MKTYVAILAAGKGLRMGLSQPKQFEMLHGKTVLEHSVDTFEKHPNIDGIFVVVHEDFLENTKRLLHVRNRPKIVGVIAGGAERMDSSYNAILALENVDCNLLIHDAARPFVSEKIITDVVDALKIHSAVSVAIPATDTVYICTDALRQAQGPSAPAVIQSSPKRETVYLAQTPQGGRLSVLKNAFERMHATHVETGRAPSLQHIATDDACVILHHLPNEKIHVVLGDVANRKITFQSDLQLKN